MYKQPPYGAINIGRPGVFGNPAAVGCVCPRCREVHHEPAATLSCYKQMLWARLQTDEVFRSAVHGLCGKKLWCPGCGISKEHCHGRILEAAANWLNTPVLFWSQAPDELGRALSNFHPCVVVCDCHDVVFDSSEHAYFWHLAATKTGKDAILRSRTAADAKKTSKQFPQEDYEGSHRMWMERALLWKFTDPELKKMLLGTFERKLIHYAPWGDTYWGVGKDMKGENVQGEMLMWVRNQIRGTKS